MQLGFTSTKSAVDQGLLESVVRKEQAEREVRLLLPGSGSDLYGL